MSIPFRQAAFPFEPRQPLALVLLLALAGLSPLARGDTQSELNAASRQGEAIMRQQQDFLRQDQERAKRAVPAVGGADLRVSPPEAPAVAPSGMCREIDEIEIGGADLLRASVLEKLHREFAGRCLGVNEIERILGLITQDYVERGYVTTRAYLPGQDLKSRRLRILVVEGLIEEYRKEGEDAQDIFIPGAFPAAPGDKLNLRDLEQGVDQINRLASNNATIDIQPGSAPGKSIVVIRNRLSRRLHANFGYDNMGSSATGKHSASLGLTVDSLLGFNDRWLLTGRGSLPWETAHHSDSGAFDFSIPAGRYSFGFNVSQSNYLNKIVLASGNLLETSGSTDTQSISGERLLYRDQASRLSMNVRLSAQQTRSFVAKQRVGVSSRDLSFVDLNLSGSTVLLGGVLSAQLGYQKGLTLFGAQRDRDDADANTPRAQFARNTLDLSFMRSFPLYEQMFSWSSQFSGQYANHPLYGSQQILIGSTTSVRGFSRASLSGDRGYYWRNELAIHKQFDFMGEHVAGRFYLGFDTGQVSGVAAGAASGTLSGATVGFVSQWRGASWELFNSRPVDGPAALRQESPQTWFRLSLAM